MNGRFDDPKKKPHERIAAVAGHFNRTYYASFKRLPDDADFRDELEPFIEREILTMVLATLKEHGTYAEATKIQARLTVIHAVIEARHK